MVRKKRKRSKKRHGTKRRHRCTKKHGKKMPTNVKAYFKYLNQGMNKTEARKKAGLPPKGKSRRKKWGPGHPLYDWQKKHRRGK